MSSPMGINFLLTNCAIFGTLRIVKDIIWDKAAKKVVLGFSLEVRKEIGSLLMLLQQGSVLGAPQAKPMRQVGASVFELRVKDSAGIYRVFYMLFSKKTILIPHAFTKKTQKTPHKEIETAKKRLRRLINETE